MSKKLENNGLWESSRMMLPEHRNALINRSLPAEQEEHSQTATKARLPTEEDLKLIRTYALLPIILTIVETNYHTIKSAPTTPLKKMYVRATQLLINMIQEDLAQIRKDIKQRHISVYEEERSEGSLRFRFVYHGYENHFSMLRDVVRAEVSVRIAQYMNAVFREHTGNNKAT